MSSHPNLFYSTCPDVGKVLSVRLICPIWLSSVHSFASFPVSDRTDWRGRRDLTERGSSSCLSSLSSDHGPAPRPARQSLACSLWTRNRRAGLFGRWICHRQLRVRQLKLKVVVVWTKFLDRSQDSIPKPAHIKEGTGSYRVKHDYVSIYITF